MARLTIAVMLMLFSSLLWSAEFCSGQYLNTREMVQAALRKYGTLYSGGDHWHRVDDIGATLDLYRLWRNLPDWRLRRLGDELEYVGYPPDKPMSPEALQWTAEQVDEAASQPRQKLDAIVGLDFAGRISEPVDAWLAGSTSDSPQWTWLQLVMSASDAPWAIAPHLLQANDPRLPAFARLKAEAWKRHGESGGIEWAVAALVLTPTGVADAQADALFQRWQTRVEGCKATQGEYAAWAVAAPLRWASRRMNAGEIADLVQPLQGLPSASQRLAIRYLSWAALIESLGPPRWPDDPGANLSAIAELADASGSELAPWVNVALTYQASTIEELADIHRQHQVEAKSARAFNLLSAADLGRLAETPGLTADMHRALVMTAFSRSVALGDVEQASRLLPQLRQVTPERAADIERRLRQDLPQKIRLDLIVLDNPQLSTWLVAADVNDWDVAIDVRNSRPKRDLPPELAYTPAIEQDLQAWLLLPQKWDRYAGMHGFSLAALDRVHASASRNRPAAVLPPTLFKVSPGSRDRHLERLVAWNEMPRLVEGNGLSHVISRDIVEWADSASNTWLKRRFIDQELMAQALSQVVRLNRGEDGGMLGQVPSGKAAFTLLHRRFPESQAARQTPYWYQRSNAALQQP